MSNLPSKQRRIRDAALLVLRVVPGAGANVNSASIDLGRTAFKPEEMEVEILMPAQASLADTKNLITTLQDSDDDSSFAAIANLATTTQLGAGGVGAAKKLNYYRLLPSVRRYLRINVAEDGSGGTLTGSVQLSILT